MTHMTEEELAQYAFDPDGLPEAEREQIENHVGQCPQCSSNLTFIRSVDAGFRDPDVWEIAERDVSATRAAIRNLAAQVAEENEQAERLLADLLGNPARTAFANLGTRKAYLTAGVVRRLLRAAGDAREREPLDALTFADAAIDVADRLSTYPEGVIHDLRAHAWKERAGALAALGQYDASLDALDHAEREYRQAPGAPLGQAVVEHARAIVHHHRGDLPRAILLLSEATAIYISLGQTDLYMRARHLMANIAFAQADIRRARAIYEELLAWGEAEGDLAWIARESSNLGRCALELGDLSAAVQSFHRSIAAFRELGMAAEVLRPEWGLGLVVLASAKPAEALVRFGEVRDQFHRRSMVADEALISLDMMDALHALRRDREIAAIASGTIQTFMRAGMLTSALTAFAYLKEAAHRGEVAPQLTQHVRQFLSRLEREPTLLFHPAQENL
jgi:tetratricopeptide (TPR) repeat protein